jgi:hypothetical protein
MQDTWTIQNEASAAQKTLATKIQLGLRRSCGRAMTMPARDKHTLCAYTGCAGNARHPDDARCDVKEQLCFWSSISIISKIETADQKRI